jgi:hypothetical protein
MAAFWGAAAFIDNRYAKAEEHKVLEKRFNYKVEKDYLIGMRDRLWQLEKQYPTPAARPPVIDQQIHELEADTRMQADKIKALEAK